MDLFECCICLGNMLEKKPRCLHCIHTFCTECLKPLIKDNKIQCPTCRKVTKLENGDVTELQINFMLAQVKEQQEKNKVSAPDLCQLCQEMNALYKCRDCPELLCKDCKIKHGDIDEFKSHAVLQLCMKHLDGATHLCSLCQKKLCRKCMIIDHTEHKQHFVRFGDGVKELKKKAEELDKAMEVEFDKFKEVQKDDKVKHDTVTKELQLLKEQKKYLTEKIKENDKLQEITTRKVENFKKLQITFKEIEKEYNKTANCLKNLTENNDTLCENFNKVSMQATEVQDKMQNVERAWKLPDFVPETLNFKLVRKRKPIVRNLKLSELILKKDIECDWEAAFIGDDVVTVTSNKDGLVRLNQAGDVVKRYKPPNKGSVYGVAVYNNSIYMVQPKYITVISDKEEVVVHQHSIDNSYMHILVKNSNDIYISDYKNPGKIHRFDVKQKKTEVVADGLTNPEYISVVQSDEGARYIVTEYGANCIRVYDEEWKELYRFGEKGSGDGEFDQIYSVAVTEMQTLLIADYGNSRVSHYTVEGNLLSHILTAADGLSKPTGLAYRFPYLWVCGDPGYVKCYQLQ